ncbi:hypothetical protein COCON_G00176110 [Conger conger]|uniref:Uncharacterized protein n=1 Tax=Conger conger TaxID=82655 RepID=A0A9Q1HSM7_CONCO|nr:hypothetical protein COCON_G00176110 [Conger conger]
MAKRPFSFRMSVLSPGGVVGDRAEVEIIAKTGVLLFLNSRENGRPGRPSAEGDSSRLGKSRIYRSYYEQHQEDCRFPQFF